MVAMLLLLTMMKRRKKIKRRMVISRTWIQQTEDIDGHGPSVEFDDQRQYVPRQPERHEVDYYQCQQARRTTLATALYRRLSTRPSSAILVVTRPSFVSRQVLKRASDTFELRLDPVSCNETDTTAPAFDRLMLTFEALDLRPDPVPLLIPLPTQFRQTEREFPISSALVQVQHVPLTLELNPVSSLTETTTLRRILTRLTRVTSDPTQFRYSS